MKYSLMIAMVFVLMFGCASMKPVIGTYDEGIAAYKNGDYLVAMNILEPLADRSHNDAMYVVAEMYRFAQGVPQNYSIAYRWHLRGGKAGNPKSQLALSSMVEGGHGVAPNFWRSAQWSKCVVENKRSTMQQRYVANFTVGIIRNRYGIEIDCHL